METLLTAALMASTAITAIVGDRIHWMKRPAGSALPALILHKISGQPDHTQAGRVPQVRYSVQFDCWAGSFAEAMALRQALNAVLDPLTAAPLQVLRTFDPPDLWEPAAGPDADRLTDLYRTGSQADVIHTES